MHLVHLGDATLFSSNEKDARLLVMPADSRVNSRTLSASFHAQSFYHFGKKGLPLYRDLHDLGTRQKEMDGVEPVSFDELLNSMLENMATCMIQGLTLL